MSKTEQLEHELNQKTKELNEILQSQCLLYNTLENNTNSMKKIGNMLKQVDVKLKHSNEYISKLEQENFWLKLSCDEWMKRAIEFQFKALSDRDTTK
jgi:hypothetical protein